MIILIYNNIISIIHHWNTQLTRHRFQTVEILNDNRMLFAVVSHNIPSLQNGKEHIYLEVDIVPIGGAAYASNIILPRKTI